MAWLKPRGHVMGPTLCRLLPRNPKKSGADHVLHCCVYRGNARGKGQGGRELPNGWDMEFRLEDGAASGDRTHDILSHSQAFCR